MPQPRKYQSNAERQAAYRERKARREAAATSNTSARPLDPIVARVMAADRRAQT